AVRWTQGSIVFQGAMHALNPVQRIGDQIAEPLIVHAMAGEREALLRAGELLEEVGLPTRRLRDYPHELSGGQRQRVMIAMALACSPDFVIADEPTTALVETCDRLAIMYAGRIVETGPAQRVYREPLHPYTEALAAAFPEIGDHRYRGHPSGLPGDPPYPSDLPGGCAFHPRCPRAFDAC